MDKLNCIEKYFAGNKAYSLFLESNYCVEPDWKKFILDKDYLVGAQVGCISGLMMAIKEDLIENKGERNYDSKLFLNELEKTVDLIATKVEGGYKLNNYVFPDAATLVAIIRNKFAHGQYIIDFEKQRVTFNHLGNSITVSVRKLVLFIMSAFHDYIKNINTFSCERSMVYFNNKSNTRVKGFNNKAEVKGAINSFNYIKFTLKSCNEGENIPQICVSCLEQFLKLFKTDPQTMLESDEYRFLCSVLNQHGCEIDFERQKLKSENDINEVLRYAEADIISRNDINYIEQVNLLGSEIYRKMEKKYNKFNPIFANIKNLLILDAIDKSASVDDVILSNYLTKKYNNVLNFGYDEYGITLVNMFNSLFMYGFDENYSVSGGYSLDRSEYLDFGKLDLSMINPSLIVVNKAPLVSAKQTRDSLKGKIIELSNKISKQENNLNNARGNSSAEVKIQKNLSDVQSTFAIVKKEFREADKKYLDIFIDFVDNADYFRNCAIIEGIRNSIAHGNYYIVSHGNMDNAEIVFNDIYEGELTFSATAKLVDFEKMIHVNSGVVLDFIKNKNSISKNNSKSIKKNN